MINIVHHEVHFDDNRGITAVEIKLKSCPEEEINEDCQHLVARVSAAFYALDFFSDYGKKMETNLDQERRDIVDIFVTLRKQNGLDLAELAKYIIEFQNELDQSPF